MYMNDYSFLNHLDEALYGPSHLIVAPSMCELAAQFCKTVDTAEVIKKRFGDVNPLDCATETTLELRPDGREEFKIRGTLPDAEMKAKARHDKYLQEVRGTFAPYAYKKVPEVKEVFFNGRATTIAWTDGTKTTVRAEEGVKFDEYSGICACFAKKAWGSSRAVKNLLKSDKIHRQRGRKKKDELPEESILKFPFNVGDPIYCSRANGTSQKEVVTSMGIDNEGLFVGTMIGFYREKDFGKIFFLTQEEAEKGGDKDGANS